MDAKDEDDWTLFEYAAFYMIGVDCQICRSTMRDDLTPTPLPIKYPEEGWIESLGKALRDEGWLVTEEPSRPFGLMTICPVCAVNRPLP